MDFSRYLAPPCQILGIRQFTIKQLKATKGNRVFILLLTVIS